MLTPKQAAVRAGVSPSLIYELCASKRLPHYRIGGGGRRGKILISPTDLDAFMVMCRVEASDLADDEKLQYIR